MATKDDITVPDMFRSIPIQAALIFFVPVLLAVAQLANSYFNDLSFFVSVPFAIVMIVFTALLTQHQLAQFRRGHLERNL